MTQHVTSCPGSGDINQGWRGVRRAHRKLNPDLLIKGAHGVPVGGGEKNAPIPGHFIKKGSVNYERQFAGRYLVGMLVLVMQDHTSEPSTLVEGVSTIVLPSAVPPRLIR